MQKFKFLTRWKILVPATLVLILVPVGLIVVFQPFRTSGTVNHSLSPTKLSTLQTQTTIFEDLFIIDDMILIAEQGISFVNISDPLHPTLINRFYDGGGVHTIRLRDNLLFYSDMSHGMEIVNISDVNHIVKLTNIPVSEDTTGIDIAGDLAFITAPEGLFIYNISNPFSPQSVYHYPSSTYFTYIEVHYNLAFICTHMNIQVFDISNTTNPVKVSTIGLWGYIRNF